MFRLWSEGLEVEPSRQCRCKQDRWSRELAGSWRQEMKPVKKHIFKGEQREATKRLYPQYTSPPRTRHINQVFQLLFHLSAFRTGQRPSHPGIATSTTPGTGQGYVICMKWVDKYKSEQILSNPVLLDGSPLCFACSRLHSMLVNE